jgi:hypothetical protein
MLHRMRCISELHCALQNNQINLRRLFLILAWCGLLLPGHLSAITFDEWRAAMFTPAELGDVAISGYTADPDGDGRRNWLEFGENTDPMLTDGFASPAVWLDEDGHLTLGFSRWLSHPGVVFVPQVTGDLVQRWKSGPFNLPEIDVTPIDANSEYVTVRDVEATTSTFARFIRVMIASDADGDGLPDDWELHNGLNPADPTDGFGDIDGDGISNADEFAQGSDPLLKPVPPPANPPPAAPSDVKVLPLRMAAVYSGGPTTRTTKTISSSTIRSRMARW